MDLSTIKSADREIEILHPGTGDKLGVRVNVMHIDDDRMKKLKRQILDKRIYNEARGKSFKADEIEDNKNNLLFTAMTAWEWYNPTGNSGDKNYDAEAAPSFEGEANPNLNRKTVFAIFEMLPWFADQINEAVGETKAFF